MRVGGASQTAKAPQMNTDKHRQKQFIDKDELEACALLRRRSSFIETAGCRHSIFTFLSVFISIHL
jgi:hypothetical protein